MNYLSVVVPRSPWTDILRAPQNECATSHTSESSENTQMNCFNLFIASVELNPSPREVTQHSFNEPKALFSLAPWSARMEHSRDPGVQWGDTALTGIHTPCSKDSNCKPFCSLPADFAGVFTGTGWKGWA